MIGKTYYKPFQKYILKWLNQIKVVRQSTQFLDLNEPSPRPVINEDK
jgi:hypothetical protein